MAERFVEYKAFPDCMVVENAPCMYCECDCRVGDLLLYVFLDQSPICQRERRTSVGPESCGRGLSLLQSEVIDVCHITKDQTE